MRARLVGDAEGAENLRKRAILDVTVRRMAFFFAKPES